MHPVPCPHGTGCFFYFPMRKSIIWGIATLLLPVLNLVAQKHDHMWIFGYTASTPNPPITSDFGRAIIDFNQLPTIAYKSYLKLNFHATASIFSDSVGSILFYSNGISLRNGQNLLIENGDTLNPGEYWENDKESGMAHPVGGFGLPFPNHPGLYFFFHEGVEVDFNPFNVRGSPIYYTLIDMNANNGKGKVLAKNQKIMTGDLAWPAACKHGNGRDWWVTMYTLDSVAQQTYLLSPAGLTGPFIQKIGPEFPMHETASKSIFSPDGKTYVRHDGKNGLRLMDFDRCTGLFSNLRAVPYPPEIWSWSVAFSPNSRFLYISKPSVVWRLDMEAPDISASFDTLSRYNGSYCPTIGWDTKAYQMQEGPDGKIYIANNSSSPCMSRIEQPNLPGQAADMAWGGFDLPRWNSATICSFPNYRLGENDNSPCDTINLQKPGDGFISTQYKPVEPSVFWGSKDDYTILPMLRATPSETARREKEAALDPKNIYQRYLDSRDPSKRAQPTEIESPSKDDGHE